VWSNLSVPPRSISAVFILLARFQALPIYFASHLNNLISLPAKLLLLIHEFSTLNFITACLIFFGVAKPQVPTQILIFYKTGHSGESIYKGRGILQNFYYVVIIQWWCFPLYWRTLWILRVSESIGGEYILENLQIIFLDHFKVGLVFAWFSATPPRRHCHRFLYRRVISANPGRRTQQSKGAEKACIYYEIVCQLYSRSNIGRASQLFFRVL